MALRIKGGKVKSIRSLKQAVKKNGGGDFFIKRVPSDDSITVRFLTEPEEWFEYREYYSEEHNFFPEIEGMPRSFIEGLGKPSQRWLAAVVDVSDNTVYSLCLPKSLAQSLLKKYDKYKTMLDRDYELVREGQGFDTTYEAIPEAPHKMNINRFEVPDLLEVLTASVPPALGGGAPDDDDDYDDDDLDDDVDDDDDEPLTRSARGRRKAAAAPARRRRPAPVDEDDDDLDDDDDDDDDDDEPVVRRKPAPRRVPPKKIAAKKPVRTLRRK